MSKPSRRLVAMSAFLLVVGCAAENVVLFKASESKGGQAEEPGRSSEAQAGQTPDASVDTDSAVDAAQGPLLPALAQYSTLSQGAHRPLPNRRPGPLRSRTGYRQLRPDRTPTADIQFTPSPSQPQRREESFSERIHPVAQAITIGIGNCRDASIRLAHVQTAVRAEGQRGRIAQSLHIQVYSEPRWHGDAQFHRRPRCGGG